MVTFVSWTNPSGDSPTAEPRTPEHPNDRTPDTCDPSPMSVGRITISRKDPRDVRDRQIITSIDGEPLATLLYGGEISREVPAGPHRLRAHNTLFWKTLEVSLEPGEHARFVVVNRAGTGTFSLLGLLGVGPLYLTFERAAEPTPGSPSSGPA